MAWPGVLEWEDTEVDAPKPLAGNGEACEGAQLVECHHLHHSLWKPEWTNPSLGAHWLLQVPGHQESEAL